MARLQNMLNKRRNQRNKRRVIIIYLLLQMQMAQRDFWVHPIISDRRFKGEYHTLYPDLREYPEKFFRWYRMSMEQFDYLLQLIRPRIEKLNNNFRASINAEQRLVVTLR